MHGLMHSVRKPSVKSSVRHNGCGAAEPTSPCPFSYQVLVSVSRASSAARAPAPARSACSSFPGSSRASTQTRSPQGSRLAAPHPPRAPRPPPPVNNEYRCCLEKNATQMERMQPRRQRYCGILPPRRSAARPASRSRAAPARLRLLARGRAAAAAGPRAPSRAPCPSRSCLALAARMHPPVRKIPAGTFI